MAAIRRFDIIALAMFALSGASWSKEHCVSFGGFMVTPPDNFEVFASGASELDMVSAGATRSASRIAFEAHKGVAEEKFTRFIALSSQGLVLNYETVIESGGSGGSEAALRGQLLHNNQPLSRVYCDTQSEDSVDPLWCLETLKTLQSCDAGCFCPEK